MEVAEKPFIRKSIWGGLARPSWGVVVLVMTVMALSWLQLSRKTVPVSPIWDGENKNGIVTDTETRRSCSEFFELVPPRKVVMSIADFGGVGDGKTSNTDAFIKAIDHLKGFGDKGGSQLNVPRGRWLTGSFNLTSNFTLFLEEGAVILGSQDPKEWPLVEPLPSYGRGRERLGERHISLIHGDSLTNVVVTGQNGSIDGQGRMWWELWWNRTLKHTRGHLLELMNSHNILISNLTFLNSPFWTIHPIYCSNVVIKGVTILAPLHSPNTDGIDPGVLASLILAKFCVKTFNTVTWTILNSPDSSSKVCIEDCYIESGDDLVAVKSGWDQYGITMARPSTNIIVRRVSGTTPTCSGVGIGSEMSGGISNVLVEGLHVRNSAAGVRIKTDKGRGGYITNITITNLAMENVKVPIRFSRGSNDHPDEGWDPKALPLVKNIFFNNVSGVSIQKAPVLEALEGAPFEGICLNNIHLEGIAPPAAWHCEFVTGVAHGVSPMPCPQLQSNGSSTWCMKS